MTDFLDRSLRLGKAYVNKVRDTIEDKLSDAERNLAKDELDREPGDAPDSISRGSAYDNDPDALMRRAEEKIAAFRRTTDSNLELAHASASERGVTPPVSNTNKTATTSADPNESDYKVLDVPPGSDMATVQAAYEKLLPRLDPRRFETASVDQQKAAEAILARINTAYDNLRKRLDPTESRFAKLEL